MIVARGLGRKQTGATGIIAAAGLGLVVTAGGIGGSQVLGNQPIITPERPALLVRRVLDDRDLTEIIPIIVEIINGRR